MLNRKGLSASFPNPTQQSIAAFKIYECVRPNRIGEEKKTFVFDKRGEQTVVSYLALPLSALYLHRF